MLNIAFSFLYLTVFDQKPQVLLKAHSLAFRWDVHLCVLSY